MQPFALFNAKGHIPFDVSWRPDTSLRVYLASSLRRIVHSYTNVEPGPRIAVGVRLC
jgi:hypothetical protein